MPAGKQHQQESFLPEEQPEPRPRNPAWDALVSVTRANEEFEAGRIAVALQAIVACCRKDGIPEDDIPRTIIYHASCYRDHFPGIALTPTALARHWYRVLPDEDEGQTFGQILDRYTRGDDDRRGG